MTGMDLYAAADRERFVDEPPKRVAAPERTPFERDRARVVHAAASRRLAAKTQVVGPQSDDFVRNRLTHSLEVAQVARDLSRALGCEPDIVETAALAHDLGHPPFGHNGERVLAELSAGSGGFEGNAQTFRLLTRLEAKTFGPGGPRLRGAQPDARHPRRLHQVPVVLGRGRRAAGRARRRLTAGGPQVRRVRRRPADLRLGAHRGRRGRRRCLEAQVMDLADDVAYSVHDVEDGVVAGRIGLHPLDRDAVWATVREWYLPDADDADLDAALAGLRAVDGWPGAAYDGSRRHLAALKNLTSDLIGRFCGAVQDATFAAADGPLVRYRADLVVPAGTEREIAVLKGIAAHYVMRADDRVALMGRQRELLARLVERLSAIGPDALDTQYADDWRAATDDAGRHRAVIDQVASLTDASAVARHDRLG